MLRGSRSLISRRHMKAITDARRVARPRFLLSLRSYSECSEGCVHSICTRAFELFRMRRGQCTRNVYSHFEAISRVPRVEYPQSVLSRWSYFTRYEARAPAIRTRRLKLFRTIRGPRTLNPYHHIGAISHVPRVTYPRSVPSLWSYFACSQGHVPSICTLTFSSIPNFVLSMRTWAPSRAYSEACL